VEMRVGALLLDRERAIADDGDAAIGGGDEIVPTDVFLAGQQRDVWHTLELYRRPGLRVRAAMCPRRAPKFLVVPVEPERLLARRLIFDEHTFLDDVEVFGLHAFV